jgi:hypothetical protein
VASPREQNGRANPNWTHFLASHCRNKPLRQGGELGP